MKNSSSQSNPQLTLKIYVRYVRRYKALFFGGACGAVAAVIAQGMIPPYIIALIFTKLQRAYALHQPLMLGDYMPYFAVFAAAMFAGFVAWRAQAFTIWRLEERVLRDLANDIYDHLQSQSQSFHTNH